MNGFAPDNATSRLARDKPLEEQIAGEFDIAIVGGGIYGAMLSLHAASCGLRVVVLERDDFGAATSFNSLRILHGGLRYLQTLDLKRSIESIRERRWFMQTFPEFVEPLPCLLPLYDQGLRRPATLRFALALDRLLSMNRNAGLAAEQQLPPGRILSRSETQSLFAHVPLRGLSGGALWHDASVANSQRLLMEVLNWARSRGAIAINYLEFVSLHVDDNAVKGLLVRDKVLARDFEISARVVINAAGPWCEDLATKTDSSFVRSSYPSLAWNVLFDRDAPAKCALGIARREPGSQIYFMHPWKGRMLVGTGHAAATGNGQSGVEEEHIAAMIAELNEAVPDLKLSVNQIEHIFSGILPVQEPESLRLSKRPVIYDHGSQGGPDGLLSVSGVKFGASRSVAAQAMQGILKRFFSADFGEEFRPGDRPSAQQGWNLSAGDLGRPGSAETTRTGLKNIIKTEAVVHLDDLVMRRTTLWECPAALTKNTEALAALFEWDEQVFRAEMDRLELALAGQSKNAGD